MKTTASGLESKGKFTTMLAREAIFDQMDVDARRGEGACLREGLSS